MPARSTAGTGNVIAFFPDGSDGSASAMNSLDHGISVDVLADPDAASASGTTMPATSAQAVATAGMSIQTKVLAGVGIAAVLVVVIWMLLKK